MKIKTCDLVGVALEYAVALAEGYKLIDVPADASGQNAGQTLGPPDLADSIEQRRFTWPPKGKVGLCAFVRPYSTGPEGDAIIDRERICTDCDESGTWHANLSLPRVSKADRRHRTYSYQAGPDRRTAAMRCWVAHKLGDTVETPDELLEKP